MNNKNVILKRVDFPSQKIMEQVRRTLERLGYNVKVALK